MRKYWDDNGWEPPSQEWANKLAILIKDSMTLLKDSIDQSKPFFLIPTIQKEGQDFLENRESKLSLKPILNFVYVALMLEMANYKNYFFVNQEKIQNISIPFSVNFDCDIGENEYFMLSDNTSLFGKSCDSVKTGPIKKENILGSII